MYVYSVKYGRFPIPVVRATLETERGVLLDGRPADRVVVNAKTRLLAVLFFRVNNRYESYVDPDVGHSLRFVSTVRQSNLSRTLIAEYDQDQHLVRFNDGRSAPILEDACDFFAALFHLSGRFMHAEDESVINLDVEGVPWRAKTQALGSKLIRSPWGKVRATETRIRFDTDHPDAERSRKTDVLTNRLVRRSTDLRIWFSDDDKAVPLKLTYRCSPFDIVAKLKEIEEGAEE